METQQQQHAFFSDRASIVVHDVDMAAALGSLGIVLRPVVTVGEKKISACFHMSAISSDKKYVTNVIRQQWKSGELAMKNPPHPFAIMMKALENRKAISRYLKRGGRLFLHDGSYKFSPEFHDLPGVKAGGYYVKVRDIKKASALAVLGCAIVAIAGTEHEHTFTIEHPQSLNVPQLLEAWRNSPELILHEPFGRAMLALSFRSELLNQIRNAPLRQIHLSSGYEDGKQVLLDSDSTQKAYDSAEKFLLG